MKRKEIESSYLSFAASPRAKLAVISVILLAMILGSLYLGFAWHRYQHMAESEALQLAQSIEALLHVEHIEALVADDRPGGTPGDALIERSLVRLVEATNSIYYAYILKKQQDDIVVALDSAAANPLASVPEKRSCEETAQVNRLPFETGQSVLTESISAPCGDWIRALVPIRASDGEAVVAVLGLSYSASQWRINLWKRMAPDIMIVACLLILVFILFNLRHKHKKLKESAIALAFQEVLYRNIFEQAPIGIVLHGSKKSALHAKYIGINPAGEAILGRDIHRLQHMTWPEMSCAEDLEAELPQFERFVNDEISSYSMEKRLIRPDGSTIWTNIKVSDFVGNPLHDSMYLCLLEDISARKQSEEALQESERSKTVFLSHIPGMAYRCKCDSDWTMEFVSEGGYALTGYQAEELLGNRSITYNEVISPEYRQPIRDEWDSVLLKRKRFHSEYEIITKSKERKWVLELGQGIYDEQGNVEALEGIVMDISEQKKREHQITYLQEHDFLTGLYNRNYMDRQKKRLGQPDYLPLSVVICDIDGLRMINDAYGHAEGDRMIFEAAGLLQSCERKGDVLGRIGGGEFMLLLPRTDGEAAQRVAEEIQRVVDGHNRMKKEPLYKINLSVGVSTKETEGQSVDEAIKSAEEYLKRRKLLNQNSSHSAIVSSIMATLYAKSQETEEHGQRLGKFCQMIGERIGLEQQTLDDLQLLSKLHDIGKIGIDDRILNKPGKLTEEEWQEMRQHPEIGCRIAMATPQLEHIAEYILHHHERWDSTGYPMGLKGDEIPVVSRILAIADAYDAMTEDRIYRKALPRETALEEIEKNAGTQFDPNIAGLFVQMIEGYGDSSTYSI